MKVWIRILPWACVLYAVGAGAGAQEAGPPLAPPPHPFLEPGYAGTTIYVDEDTFLFPTTDKDYTTGFQFAFSGYFARTLTPPLRALDWLTQMKRVHDGICNENDPFCGNRAYQSHSLLAGLTFFTPRKGEPGDPDCEIQEHGCVLALTRPLYDDRPYASILYLTVSRETARGKNAWLSDFTLGVLGLGIGEKLQTWFHTGIGNDVAPGGWPFQISEGGEVTAKYRVAWRRLLVTGFYGDPGSDPDLATPAIEENHLPRRWIDLTTDVEGNVGYYVNALGGVKLRLGLIDSPFWSAQRHPVAPTLAAPGPRKIREAYVWASGGGTLFAYNALLEGQFKHSEVTLPFGEPGAPGSVELRRAVWDYQFGGTVRFGAGLGKVLKHLGLTYQYNRHAPLFTGPHSRQHAWGGIYIGIYPNAGQAGDFGGGGSQD
jgi:Outer membrane protein LpxR